MFHPVHNTVGTEGAMLSDFGAKAGAAAKKGTQSAYGWLTPSYVVSALLHPAVKEHYGATALDMGVSLLDVGLHLALWVTAMLMEFWFHAKKWSDGRAERFEELANLSLWTFIFALVGIVIALVVNVITVANKKGQSPFGSLYPFVTVLIEGGTLVSIVASLTYYVVAMLENSKDSGLPTFATATSDDGYTERAHLLYLAVLKILAVYFATTNAKFLPPAREDFKA